MWIPSKAIKHWRRSKLWRSLFTPIWLRFMTPTLMRKANNSKLSWSIVSKAIYSTTIRRKINSLVFNRFSGFSNRSLRPSLWWVQKGSSIVTLNLKIYSLGKAWSSRLLISVAPEVLALPKLPKSIIFLSTKVRLSTLHHNNSKTRSTPSNVTSGLQVASCILFTKESIPLWIQEHTTLSHWSKSWQKRKR